VQACALQATIAFWSRTFASAAPWTPTSASTPNAWPSHARVTVTGECPTTSTTRAVHGTWLNDQKRWLGAAVASYYAGSWRSVMRMST
jgi:hypothetical protein